MSPKITISPGQSPKAVGPYHHAVRVGNLLFCSGQIPVDPATGQLVEGDIRKQTKRVLDNIRVILDHEKLSFSEVVKTTVFLTDLKDFTGMNEIYAGCFQNDFPARSTVQIAGLPKGARIEIELIAHYPSP